MIEASVNMTGGIGGITLVDGTTSTIKWYIWSGSALTNWNPIVHLYVRGR